MEHKRKIKAINKCDKANLVRQGKVNSTIYVNGRKIGFIRKKNGISITKVIYSKPHQIINDEARKNTSTTSKGNQIKWHNDGLWIKADGFGYEGLAEEISSVLMMSVQGVGFVEYSTCQIYERKQSYLGCCNF